MLDPAIGALLAALFALLFASAAAHKLRDFARFSQVFAAYRLLPPAFELTAVAVPVLEALVAVGLLLPSTRAGAGWAGAGLLLLYALAIAVNLRRGRLELSCGCGGPGDRRPIARWMVVRNLVLAVLLLGGVTVPWRSRPLTAVDAITIAGGLAVGALIYVSLEQLLARVVPRTARLQGAA